MQRLKAVEGAALDGDWSSARHLELLPPHIAQLTSDRERELAMKAEVRAQKLRGMLQQARQGYGLRRDEADGTGVVTRNLQKTVDHARIA